MGILRDDELGPDGVRLAVDWDAMRVRDSVFVPCINSKAALKTIKVAFDSRGWKSRVIVCQHKGILGVRVWRIT